MVGQRLSSYYMQPIRDLSLVLENSKEDENIPEISEASGNEIIEVSNIPDFHPKLLENSSSVRDPENGSSISPGVEIEHDRSEIDFPDFHSNFHPQLSENSSFVCVPEILETSGSEEIQIISENSKIYSDFGDVYSNFHPELSENSFVRLETPEIQNKPDIEVAIDSINSTSAEITEKVELLPGIISNIQITIEVTKSGTINVVTDVPFNFDILGNLATKHKSSEVLESLINSTISSISISSNLKLSSSMIEIPKSNIEKLILIINEKIPKCPKILMAESQLRELFSCNELFENGVAAILSLFDNEEIENSEKFDNAINCIKNILKIYINLGLKSAADIAEELNNRILANYNPDVNDNCF